MFGSVEFIKLELLLEPLIFECLLVQNQRLVWDSEHNTPGFRNQRYALTHYWGATNGCLCESGIVFTLI